VTRAARGRGLRGQAGYSLVEMMTVMAILSVILTGLTTLFVQGTNSQRDLNSRFEAQQQVRLALDKLRREIHCAKEGETSGGTGAAAEVTLRLPAQCPTAGGVQSDVRWCAVNVAASRYALYRMVGATCNATGVKWADYLTQATLFDFQTQATTQRARLRVELPVDVKVDDATPAYRLCDVIVLRNSGRVAPDAAMLGYTDTADVSPC
jgi:prepilin-type N-terminal cleavage/methylation domain-containing protein